MSSPQDHPDEVPALANDPGLEGDAQDPERVGLLGYTRVLERRPTSIELRLAILAFWCLCVASIGFGLFAGELAKFQQSRPGGDPPTRVITTTIFLSPTNAPSPPEKSVNVCSSGPCVDVAGDLRRTIQWSDDPCVDYAKFSTARIRPPASQVVSAETDQVIYKTLATESTNPIIQKLRVFKSLCPNKAKNTSYSEFSPILQKISALLLTNKPDRFGAVLAYLHSASVPAFFKATATNYHFAVEPQTISIEGIEDAFASLYRPDEVSIRILGVENLVSTLSALLDDSRETKSITIDELQQLSCGQSWIPCWIHWKDYYAALDPGQVIRRLHVQSSEYFSKLGRVFFEQTDKVLESYFHWITIFTIRKKDCIEELKLHFGPSLLKHVLLISQDQLKDWKNRTQTAEVLLQSVLDLDPKSGLPQAIETLEMDQNQEEELSSIQSDDWVGTVFELARIKTKNEFREGHPNWNMVGTELKIVGDKLYFPMGAFQAPLLYSPWSELPKSLLFGSLGFNLFLGLHKLQNHSSSFEDTCQLSLAESFQIWKKYQKIHPNEMKIKLVGLVDEITSPDQFFYLAFGRLGLPCPEIEKNPDFMDTFNCSLA